MYCLTARGSVLLLDQGPHCKMELGLKRGAVFGIDGIQGYDHIK